MTEDRNGFHTVVEGLTSPGSPIDRITPEQWREFDHQLPLYLLSGQRVGQAFCNHFGIGMSPLFYFDDADVCLRWIKDHYL